jgi:hypothetical protein
LKKPGRGKQSSRRRRPEIRASAETKAAFKTTELAAYVVGVIGVLIAAAIVNNADAGGLGAWGATARLRIRGISSNPESPAYAGLSDRTRSPLNYYVPGISGASVEFGTSGDR